LLGGVLAGTSTFTYILPGAGCTANVVVTVNPLPVAITGASSVCVSSTTTLNDVTTGGRWTSTNVSVATVGTTAIVTGLTPGTTTINYTLLTTGCGISEVITVNPNPSSPRGNAPVCAGSTITLFEVGGGTWASSNTGIATVGSSSGVVGGVSFGNPIITYTLPTGCFTSLTATINPLPVAITGSGTVGIGSTITLADAVTGGTWSSSATGVATVNTSTGAVRGLSTGSATITYAMPCGSVFKVVSVSGGREDNNGTSIAPDPAISDIHVIPNPNNGLFTIKGTLGTTNDVEVTVEVTDMLGQVVYTGKVIAQKGEISQQVQLPGSVANGMYILNLHTDKENNVFHIVVEQ